MLGDIQDQASIDQIAEQCKVVIATAGPFAQYGTAVVDACVRTGADYCDITGTHQTPLLSANSDTTSLSQAIVSSG